MYPRFAEVGLISIRHLGRGMVEESRASRSLNYVSSKDLPEARTSFSTNNTVPSTLGDRLSSASIFRTQSSTHSGNDEDEARASSSVNGSIQDTKIAPSSFIVSSSVRLIRGFTRLMHNRAAMNALKPKSILYKPSARARRAEFAVLLY